MPRPSTTRPATASQRAGASQNSAKPAALTASAPSSTRGAAHRSRNQPPASRPAHMPAMITDTAAVAVAAEAWAWVRSSSATHRFRDTSTEPVAIRQDQASQ